MHITLCVSRVDSVSSKGRVKRKDARPQSNSDMHGPPGGSHGLRGVGRIYYNPAGKPREQGTQPHSLGPYLGQGAQVMCSLPP